MKKIRVFINGFGRIGRSAARILLKDNRFELVGINDIYDFVQMQHLFKYDSIYGKLDHTLKVVDGCICIDEQKIELFNEPNPENLDLTKLNVDILLQCSGIFLTTKKNLPYIQNGAKKVIISAPSYDETPTYIVGINDKQYNGEKIISNSSCSTNALLPILKIIDENLGIKSSLMQMIHSYTADQNLLDVKHSASDIRRARSATTNILPLQSSAVKATEIFLPHLKGKLQALSVRIPVASTTMYDININIKKSTTKEKINSLFKNSSIKHILAYTDEKCVSSDFISSPYSATIDLNLTQVIQKDLIKIIAWQDNEYGYAKRLIDLAYSIN